MKVAGPSRHLKLRGHFCLCDRTAIRPRYGFLFKFARMELLLKNGFKEICPTRLRFGFEIPDLGRDMDRKEGALMACSKEALAVDFFEHRPLIFFGYVWYFSGSTLFPRKESVLVEVLLHGFMPRFGLRQDIWAATALVATIEL